MALTGLIYKIEKHPIISELNHRLEMLNDFTRAAVINIIVCFTLPRDKNTDQDASVLA